jgi:hypothetical protein
VTDGYTWQMGLSDFLMAGERRRGGFAQKMGQTQVTSARHAYVARRVGGQTPFRGKAVWRVLRDITMFGRND